MEVPKKPLFSLIGRPLKVVLYQALLGFFDIFMAWDIVHTAHLFFYFYF